jgi:hypothetical protein
MIGYRIQIPDADNKFVAELRAKLYLASEPIMLETVPGTNDEACGCFENVQKRVNTEGGDSLFGWQFWEHPYMIEAEFHAVWRKPDGSLVDITPKDDREIHRILFVEDKVRKYSATQTDNVRINITGNGLIDDLIEVEKAKYRFLNKDGRQNIIGEVMMVGDDALLWQSILNLSSLLEQSHFAGGNINSSCFCGSGRTYNGCHREIVQKGMLEI